MTTLKVLTIAGVLAVAPGLSMAMCNSKHQQAQSCASGTTWDSASQSCVPVVNS